MDPLAAIGGPMDEMTQIIPKPSQRLAPAAIAWSGLTRGRDVANPCGYCASERGRNIAFGDRRSENVNAQHPPHEEQGDDGHDDIADPLPGGLWFGGVFHGDMVAGWGRKGSNVWPKISCVRYLQKTRWAVSFSAT